MSVSTLTSKGQTTIPSDIRAYLQLDAGDKLEFIKQENGTVLMVPATIDVAELQGILPKPSKPVTLEAMHRSIRARGGRKA